MGNMENKILDAAKVAEKGSESSIGAHILHKLTEGTEGQMLPSNEGDGQGIKTLEEEPLSASFVNQSPEHKDSSKKGERNHPGNGRKADRAALSEELVEIKKIRSRVENDLARFERDKEVLTKEIEQIKARIKEAEDLGQSTIAKNWGVRLKKAEDILQVVEKGAPTRDPISDEVIFKELSAYRHARDRQTQAELKINRDENPRALGDYTRAQAEAFEISNKIEQLVRERSEKTAGAHSQPVGDEGILYTHEQATADKKAWELKHITAPKIFDQTTANDPYQEETVPFPIQHNEETDILNETEPEKTNMEPKLTLEAVPVGDMTPPTEAAEQQATADNWQDKAVENFESNGGKVLDDSFPVLTEVVEKPTNTTEETLEAPAPAQGTTSETSPSEKTSDPVLTPEQIEAFAAKNKETRERILGNITRVEGEIETRAEKAGMSKGLLRNVGEAWNKFPTRYKLLLTAGMAVSGLGAAALGATATAGTIAALGAGLRGVIGAGMFVAFEKLLENRAEKGGVERTGAEKVRDTAIAAALSIFMVGVLPGILRDYAAEHGVTEKVVGLFGNGTTQAGIPLSHESLQGNILDTGVYIETAKPGDSVWTMAERQLAGHYGEKFTGLSPEKQSYIIDAIKDKVVEYPESYGIAGSDASALEVGEHVDFGGLLANEAFMNETFSGAQGLSGEEIGNIANYQGEVVETPARTVSPSEFAEEPFLIDFTAPEQTTEASDLRAYTSPFVTEEITPAETMPAEFTPSNPQVIEYANQQVHGHINNLFGSKGFLGIGAEDGVNSINWKDPEVGFANKTVEQVMNAKPSNFPEDGARHFGIEDYSATEKMKSYLTLAGKETGVMPHRGENVQTYINRAAAVNIDRFMKNG